MVADITVREAEDADLNGVRAIYSETGLDGGKSFTLDEFRDHYRRFQKYPNYRLFVAAEGETVVGTYALLVMDNLAKRGTPSAIIEDIAVLPQFQSKGIGRMMIAHARELAAKAG